LDFAYDDQNIFAKILRGEIPNTTVYEDEFCLAFHDINPAAPVHVLVIPKGPYVSLDHMSLVATDAELVGYMRALGKVVEVLGLEDGFRTIANTRSHGVQDVPHLHFHIIGGKRLGPMMPAS